ncbi:MAG: thioredoxin [Acidobacteria bacterium]|nr:thioredoxin [Acidobacteriota bacterium]
MQSSSSVAAAAAETFDDVVLGGDRPVVVDFWAPWCGPCRRFAPIFEALAAELRDRLDFVSVNVEAEPALGDRLQIFSIPTLKLFRAGREVASQVGAGTKDQTRATLEQWLAARPQDEPAPVSRP